MSKIKKPVKSSRRRFLSKAAILGTVPFLPPTFPFEFEGSQLPFHNPVSTSDPAKSIIGNYGPWATSLSQDPPPFSFRHPKWKNLKKWRKKTLAKTKEWVAAPELNPKSVNVKAIKKYNYDGLSIEELEWKLPYGRPTQGILLKPANARGPLPAVLGLHDHGGQKYFGKRKITKTSDVQHPVMVDHQKNYYSGKAWANEIAKRGYVVLVHDVFTFGSRRVQYQDISNISWGLCRIGDKTDQNPEHPDNIKIYNTWAAEHEHIMSKSLFCGGTTWPGMTLAEDQVALSILANRSEVDASKIGCCGLSGGGLRTDYLAGLDGRVACAVSVGFMSTWNDFLLNKSYTHTWMTYTPLLPKYLDFPEILGLRVPKPTLVLNDIEDELYTLSEMKKADRILKSVFGKAGYPDRYQGNFYPGPHKFDEGMQKDAFDWFDRWLKG
jgi:dienelactone hydrolase